MSVARAIWSQTFAPGSKIELKRIPCDVKLSLVTLDEKLVDQGRSSVKLTQNDPEEDETITFVLANLIPGKIEAQIVDLIISEDEDIIVEVTGKNTVHLSGNYIIQSNDMDGDSEYDSEEEGDEIDEEAFRLQDVSSDVEIDNAELMDEDGDSEEENRFEEIVEDVKVVPVKKEEPAPSAGSKKQKKNKGGDKPASAVKPEAIKVEAKPASAAPTGAAGGEKKNKKNKNKNKEKK